MQPLANTAPLLVLVEDSASMALQFRFHFEALGYEVLMASTGQAGLSLVQQLAVAELGAVYSSASATDN